MSLARQTERQHHLGELDDEQAAPIDHVREQPAGGRREEQRPELLEEMIPTNVGSRSASACAERRSASTPCSANVPN
jgi:hypothetical protein